MMTRDEQLAACKERALAELEFSGEISAVASMIGDMTKYLGFAKGSVGYDMLVALGIKAAADGDAREVRRWIEGFN